MTPVFGLRLCLDLPAAGLLVFSLSYWWLGDVAHQVAGTAMFLLLTVHNVSNRLWYGRTARTRPGAAGWFGIGATAILALATLALLATSAAITTALPDWMPPAVGSTIRQVHVLAAYWAFAAVAVHLGLRWPIIMAATRHVLGITRPVWWRGLVLQILVLGVAVQGIRSFTALDMAGRLTMRMSLDWWNFEEGALGFFAHCAFAAGLLVTASYYASRMLRASGALTEAAPREHAV